MKASKTQKHLKEIPYPPKKSFLKEKKYYTSKDKCANFTYFFRMRMPKINNSNLSNEKQKELKMDNFKKKYQKYLC